MFFCENQKESIKQKKDYDKLEVSHLFILSYY